MHFSPIAPRPKRHKRYNRTVEEIRQLEERLLGHLQTVTRDLERRIEVRKRKHQW
jgi:hypothetical protein